MVFELTIWTGVGARTSAWKETHLKLVYSAKIADGGFKEAFPIAKKKALVAVKQYKNVRTAKLIDTQLGTTWHLRHERWVKSREYD